MRCWKTIWSFRTKHFAVICSVTEDDDLDLSWDEDDSVAHGLNSGHLCAFIARVQVTSLNGTQVYGTDQLGGCIYTSPQEFLDKPGEHGYFRDMVREAIHQTRWHQATTAKLRTPWSQQSMPHQTKRIGAS